MPEVTLLAHRGLWRATGLAPNSTAALVAAFEAGFGIETDVRDRDGVLVVSHDPATSEAERLSEVLASAAPHAATLALNVKADGLAPLLAQALAGYPGRWFAFDMSAPETVRYAASGLPFYTRHSDLEPEPVLAEAAAGVWLDCFRSEWYDDGVVAAHAADGRRVAIVSPELHGREHRALLGRLGGWIASGVALDVCTDRPEDWAEVIPT